MLDDCSESTSPDDLVDESGHRARSALERALALFYERLPAGDAG